MRAYNLFEYVITLYDRSLHCVYEFGREITLIIRHRCIANGAVGGLPIPEEMRARFVLHDHTVAFFCRQELNTMFLLLSIPRKES